MALLGDTARNRYVLDLSDQSIAGSYMKNFGMEIDRSCNCGKRLATILIGIVVLLSGATTAAEDKKYDISKSWFQPKLSADNNAPVCAQLLAKYSTAFKGSAQDILYAESLSKRERVSRPSNLEALNEVAWNEFSSGNEVLKIAEFRVKGNYFAFARRYYSIGWREGYHHQILITKPFSEYGLQGEAVKQFFETNSFGQLFNTDGQKLYRPVYADEAKQMDWKSLLYGSLVNIYTRNGEAFVLLEKEHALLLFKLESERVFSLQCEVQSTPTYAAVSSQIKNMPSLAGLWLTLSEMMGTECYGGTMNALAGRQGQLSKSFHLMTFRPWFLTAQSGISPKDLSSTRAQIERGLDTWGHSGLWNFTKFQKFSRSIGPAESELSAYYAKNFSLEPKESRLLAQSVISVALDAGFGGGDWSDGEHESHKKLLTGTATQEDFENPETLEALKAEVSEETEDQEALINFAIRQKKTLAMLLKLGASPNTRNWFGKTPLMYAAQFDELESAKLLLAHGVRTDAYTIGTLSSCIRATHLTALHYAMKYASRDFIKLLVRYGAPLHAKDTLGKTPYDYLSLHPNKLLKSSDIEELRVILAPPSEAETKRLSVARSREAEKLYQEGKIEQAYWAVEKALMLDGANESALSNKSLISLKLRKYGESAMAASRLLSTTRSSDMKANAHFNLGLACLRSEQTTINYDGKSFCDVGRYVSKDTRSDESILANFLLSYEAKPSADRLSAVLSQFDKKQVVKFRRICNLQNSNSGVKSVVFNEVHWYFLTDAKVPVPFQSISGSYSDGTSFFSVKSKKTYRLSDSINVERWELGANPSVPIFMDNIACLPRIQNGFDKQAKNVAVFPASTTENVEPSYLLKGKFKKLAISIVGDPQLVLFFYGHNTEFVLDGNMNQVKAIFVYGNSLVTLPAGVDIDVARSAENNSLHTVVDFPRAMNGTIRYMTGQDFHSIVNMGAMDRIVLNESLLNKNLFSQTNGSKK